VRITQLSFGAQIALKLPTASPERNFSQFFLPFILLISLFACTPADPSALIEETARQAEAGTQTGEQHINEEPVPEGPPEPNMVRWGTASEKDNFGFEVYRGLSESGPFEKINPEVIAAAGTTDLPQKYEFSDSSIEADTVYWYYIESISMSGERKRISPIYSSKPKPASKP
jgi:hypothetical protein